MLCAEIFLFPLSFHSCTFRDLISPLPAIICLNNNAGTWVLVTILLLQDSLLKSGIFICNVSNLLDSLAKLSSVNALNLSPSFQAQLRRLYINEMICCGYRYNNRMIARHLRCSLVEFQKPIITTVALKLTTWSWSSLSCRYLKFYIACDFLCHNNPPPRKNDCYIAVIF